MMEGHQHTNLWAEKLSQVSLPDNGAAWLAMEVLLDKEMPGSWIKDRRRWLLLVFLLLLLIGVCNCPGRGRFSAVTSRWSKAVQPVPVSDKIARGPSVVADGRRTPSPDAPPVAGNPSNATRVATRSRYTPTAPVKHRRLHSGSEDATPGGSPTADSPGAGSPIADSRGAALPQEHASVPLAGHPDSSARATPKKKDSVATPVRKPVVKDSTNKKPLPPPTPSPTPKKKPEKKREGGFMVGIGLNQFFTIGGQQASSWNSGGITGTLSDYIPVPMIRYYFNSRLYVQLEAQINTPQYTKKNLVITETGVDSSGPTTSTQSSVSVNKLFYFNVPLSVHYTIFDHLDLGAGLQFSRLTNGIGVFSDDVYSINANGPSRTIVPVQTQTQTQTKSFKGDSTYREIKTSEFRFLLDASYTYQHFILGLRYNQALSKFIDVRLSSGQITQARNSSLQLYLRYILWDGRKKKPMLPAK
jgi:hypothetical protein